MCYLISNAVNNEMYSTQCQSNIFNLYHRNSILIITYMHTNTSLLFPELFIMSMHTDTSLLFPVLFIMSMHTDTSLLFPVLFIMSMHTNTSLLFPVLFIMSMHTQYNLFFTETENNVTQIVLQCF